MSQTSELWFHKLLYECASFEIVVTAQEPASLPHHFRGGGFCSSCGKRTSDTRCSHCRRTTATFGLRGIVVIAVKTVRATIPSCLSSARRDGVN
jgi:hypothetical protein